MHRWGWHNGEEWIYWATENGRKGGKKGGPISFKGRQHTEETKRKLSEKKKGKKQSRETIEKRVAKNRMKKRSEEFKKKASERMKGNKHGCNCRHTEEHKRRFLRE